MTALPSGYTYEHVEVSGGVVERPYHVPKYVDETMEFWGWWHSRIKDVRLGYPRESILSRWRREVDGVRSGIQVDNEDYDKLGESIDKIVCQLGFTMIQICKHVYIYRVGVRVAADRMYSDGECPYAISKEAWREIVRRTFHGAQWYLAGTLREQHKRLQTMSVSYG